MMKIRNMKVLSVYDFHICSKTSAQSAPEMWKRDEKGISFKKNEQVLRKIHKESAATNDMLVVKTSRKH